MNMASSIQYQGASGSDITDDATLQSSSDSSVSAASESLGNGVEPIAIVGMGTYFFVSLIKLSFFLSR